MFFFKQKTAYELRISDWSSDVCSSDLKEFSVTDDAVRDLIRYYTREAGFRTLERELARLARKALRKILEGDIETAQITPENLASYAGVRKFRHGVGEEENQIGADRKSTRLNSSHSCASRMPSSA